MGAAVKMRLRSERGTTLVETAIACAILLVVTVGLLSMVAVATTYTENHGHLEARTTEYAQDKMEQLLALAFTDSVSNSVVFPAAITGGTGLSVGGSVNTAAPVNGYVDWLAYDGSLLGGGTTAPAKWFYERAWQVCYLQSNGSCATTPASGMKQVAVTVRVRSSVGRAIVPKSTVAALKTSSF